MRAGGGKEKGGEYERKVCKLLSLWVSQGKKEDLYWRSAMSGGRATVGKKAGKNLNRQAGDITCVAEEGHSLTNRFYIETKHYKSVQFEAFLLTDKGDLTKFWRLACKEAAEHGKQPMLIINQHRTPDFILTRPNTLQPIISSRVVLGRLNRILIIHEGGYDDCEIRLFSELLKCRYKGV